MKGAAFVTVRNGQRGTERKWNERERETGGLGWGRGHTARKRQTKRDRELETQIEEDIIIEQTRT